MSSEEDDEIWNDWDYTSVKITPEMMKKYNDQKLVEESDKTLLKFIFEDHEETQNNITENNKTTSLTYKKRKKKKKGN